MVKNETKSKSDEPKEQKKRDYSKLLIAILAVFLLFALVGVGYLYYEKENLIKQVEQLDSEVITLNQQISDLNSFEDQVVGQEDSEEDSVDKEDEDKVEEDSRFEFEFENYIIKLDKSRFWFEREPINSYFDMELQTQKCSYGKCYDIPVIGFSTEPIKISYDDQVFDTLEVNVGGELYKGEKYSMGEGGPLGSSGISNVLVQLQDDLFISMVYEIQRSYNNFCAEDCTDYFEEKCVEMSNCEDFDQDVNYSYSTSEEDTELATSLLEGLTWETK